MQGCSGKDRGKDGSGGLLRDEIVFSRDGAASAD